MRNSNQPDVAEIRLTTILNALSDPVRLKLVLCLARSGEKNCSAFEVDHISKSTLSHHVRILREGGIIQRRIEGKQHFYSVRLDDLNSIFPGLMESILQIDEQLI